MIVQGELDYAMPAGYQRTSRGRRMAPVRYLSTFLHDCHAAWWARFAATPAQSAIGVGETDYRCPVAGRALDPDSPKIHLEESEFVVSPHMVRAATIIYLERKYGDGQR